MEAYHARTVEAVRAENQAVLYDSLMHSSNEFLSTEERDILSWAVNAQARRDRSLRLRLLFFTSSLPFTTSVYIMYYIIYIYSCLLTAQVTPPPRLKKSADGTQIYKKATAVEALIGHLYLTDPSRLNAVMELVIGDLDMAIQERKAAAKARGAAVHVAEAQAPCLGSGSGRTPDESTAQEPESEPEADNPSRGVPSKCVSEAPSTEI